MVECNFDLCTLILQEISKDFKFLFWLYSYFSGIANPSLLERLVLSITPLVLFLSYTIL